MTGKGRRSRHLWRGRGQLVAPEYDVPLRTLLLAAAAFSGSVVAVGFVAAVKWIFTHVYPALAQIDTWLFACASFAVITACGLAVGVMGAKIRPSAVGSGIPQLKVAYRNHWGVVSFKDIVFKLVGGILSLGGGFSLGNEGPMIFCSGAVSSYVAGIFGCERQRRKAACAAGVAAGLAAAFNAPLAAMAFVIDEFSGRIDRMRLGGVLMSGVIGAVTSWMIMGNSHFHILANSDGTNWLATYALTPAVALFAAMLGTWFQKETLRLRARVRESENTPQTLKPMFGAWGVWVVGMIAFLATKELGDGRLGVFGLGYTDISAALNNELAWKVALLLLVGKMVATALSFAFGGIGGVFAPSLFFGAMSGVVAAGIAREFGAPIGGAETSLLALVGISACFGAIDRAPLTAVLLAFELTACYETIPLLMIATVVSQSYARHFSDKEDFYDAVIRQDGIRLRSDEEVLF